ncbi:MAG TPA: segregation/condensation protein A [Myxococcota bacterium]|jgi:segregation and condensation protein A
MSAFPFEPDSGPPESGAGSPYAVKLALFEGPLDLLLHLIRVNEVEITDIPIARISEQYLATLEGLRDLDLDVAGEFLLMAATLAWIKSRMLLPPDGLDADGEGPDPRAELVARLLEYQRFKEVAAQLAERRWLGRDVFEAHASPLEPRPESEREIEVGVFQLIEAYRRVLARAGPSAAPHEVEVETVTVRERMLVVMKALELRPSLEFTECVLTAEGALPSRSIFVATFLAILELSRLAALRLYQGVDGRGVPEGPIHLRRSDEPGSGAWTELVAEVM